MNCLQLCLYNICKKYCIADYLMFCGSWCFSHDDNMNISQALSIPLEDRENVFLKEYQGLSTTIISFESSNTESILQTVSEKDCNMDFDVVIHIDSYDCPWHKGFRKLNIPHYVHITNIDYEKKVLICDDPYFNVFQIELSFENFMLSCKTIRIFQYNPIDRDINSNVILHYIKKRTRIKQITKDIISFAHRILEVESLCELFDYKDDIFFCTNVRILKFIADSRYGLSYLFSHLSLSAMDGKKPLLINIANQFKNCGLLYEKTNNYYMKLYYSVDVPTSDIKGKLQSISNKLIEIAGMEIMLYNQLSQLEKK